MRRLSLSLLGVLCLSIGIVAQAPDRSKPPAIGPAPTLKLPAIQKRTLGNGLAVWIVEHHEVPVVQVNLIVPVRQRGGSDRQVRRRQPHGRDAG